MQGVLAIRRGYVSLHFIFSKHDEIFNVCKNTIYIITSGLFRSSLQLSRQKVLQSSISNRKEKTKRKNISSGPFRSKLPLQIEKKNRKKKIPSRLLCTNEQFSKRKIFQSPICKHTKH